MLIKTTYPQIIKNLLLLSLLIIIIDAFLGLETFIFNSNNLAVVYKLSFILKFLLCFYIFFKSFRIKIGVISLVIILFAVINLFRSISNFDPDIFTTSFYFYLMIFIGIESGRKIYQLAISPKEYTPSKSTINFIYVVIQLLIGIYFFLYTTGVITYFGMGLQLYIITPFFKKNVLKKQSYLLILNLFTGKRSTLIILLIQFIAIIKEKVKFQKIRLILISLFLILSALVVKQNTTLLDRFDVINEYSDSNLTDIDSEDSLFALSMITGGRSQEIFSYFMSDLNTNLNILIGSPSTSSFILSNNFTGEAYKHHYFHFSPMNYLKHFGLIICTVLFLIQLKIFYKLFMNYNQLDVISSLFIGYFVAMFFGAIVVVDILFWFSFGYSLEFCKNKIK